MDERKCKVCGCTQDSCRQCIKAQGYPCYWVAEDLCSRCKNERQKHGVNDAGCMREIGLTTVKDLDGDEHISGIYGMEVLIDCYACNTKLFHRKYIRRYFKGLVELLDMQADDLHFWDDVGVPKEKRQTRAETKGTSAIQFILTSNITIHCLDILERVYVNIFSCKEFDAYKATRYTQDFFEAVRVHDKVVIRQ